MSYDKAVHFLATLITHGRRTGKEHAVTLRAVYHNGVYYFSRHRPDGDWFRNALQNGSVKIIIGGKEVVGNAIEVTDQSLLREIARLKYPGEARAAEPRVAIQVTPDE